MSTTPTISKRIKTPYTVIGGGKKDTIRRISSLITIMLLNRAGKFDREQILREFQEIPFAEILCIEGPELAYDIEDRSQRFPDVRFLLLKEKITIGETINLGFEETTAKYVLVVWTDMRISHLSLNPKLVERLDSNGYLCTVPLMKTMKSELIPSLHVPAYIGRKLKAVPWDKVKDGMLSLFPFDFCGIYDRKKFLLNGGFDQEIKNPYWQKMDFGFRTFMWGDRIGCDSSLVMSYISDVPIEDSTPDAGYKIFYLKNIAVKCRKLEGFLPSYYFLRYVLRSDTGPIYSLKEFNTVRRWVRNNSSRFKKEASSVAAGWEIPEND